MLFGLRFVGLPALVGSANIRGPTSIDSEGVIDIGPAPRKEGDCGGTSVTFEEFVQHHRRQYATESKEYKDRKALFEERVEEARAHNCRPEKKFWTAGITHLSDRTAEELARLRGRKGGRGEAGGPTSGGGNFADERVATLESKAAKVSSERGEATPGDLLPLPEQFNWFHLQATQPHNIIDQGACGSCWASATVAMLRAHTDIYAQHRNFSIQQLVSCVPNPQECGGSGGCNGSTGELALDYVMHNGLGDEAEFPYQDTDLACPLSMLARNLKPIPQPNHSSFLGVTAKEPILMEASPARTFGMIGWSRLPVNNLNALFQALYQEGPVAVSIVAGAAWNGYISGVMNNCSQSDMVVNHLVVLIGYGKDSMLGAKYWTLQNSWGSSWGEGGTIRMIRQEDAAEQAFCGMDDQPLVGTGCKGGPEKVWVCGSCGVLYDNVVAHFHGSTPSAQEMLQRQTQR